MFTEFRYFDILGIFNFLGGGRYPRSQAAQVSVILNLLNSYVPLWILSITGLGFKNGLYIFMMRQCFKNVPDELEESAYRRRMRNIQNLCADNPSHGYCNADYGIHVQLLVAVDR